DILVDGQKVGRTPLAKPIAGLTVGTHKLRLEAEGYTPFDGPVEVRFQKRSEVVVRMMLIGGGPRPPADPPWFPWPWSYAASGVGGVIVGYFIGRAFAKDSTVDCQKDPATCMPR